MSTPAATKIISVLGERNDQSYLELWAKLNISSHTTLSNTLKQLVENNTLVKHGRIYHLEVDIKSSSLRYIFDNEMLLIEPIAWSDALRNNSDAFEIASLVIRSAISITSKLTLEKNSLTVNDQECKLIEDALEHCNETIRTLFNTLQIINPKQTLALKTALGLTVSKPFGQGSISRAGFRIHPGKKTKLVRQITPEGFTAEKSTT